jgi:outer membrane protein assembly factor BamB
MRRLGFAGLLLVLWMAGSRGVGAGTEHVRGPQYDGVDPSSDPVLPWPEAGPTILWRVPLGQGYSGFVVVGNRAFTQVQRRSGQYVVCLNLSNGSTVWETRYGWPWQMDGQWPGPYATPTYADGRIYFAGAYGLVGCVDAAGGRVCWSHDIRSEFGGRGMHFGYSATPLVEFGKVYVPTGSEKGAVLALNAEDGQIAWQSGSQIASYSSLIPISCGGITQIVSFLEVDTIANDPVTGEQLWSNTWRSGYCAHGTWPLYSEPYLFRTLPFRIGCRVDRVVCKEFQYSLEPVWENNEICGDFFSSVIVDEHVYGFDVKSIQAAREGSTPGEFVCLSLLTGEVRWRTPVTGHASVIACGNKLILLNEHGVVIIAEANPEEYTELDRASVLTSGICWTTPTLHENYLLVRNQHEAVCVYLGGHDLVPVVSGSTAQEEHIHWLDRYHTPAMWAPGFRSLAFWYAFNVLGVFGFAWICHLPFRSGTSAAFHLFLGLTMMFSLAGLPAYTRLVGVFVFTWPAALFVSFLWMLVVSIHARESGRRVWKVLARVLLILFVVVCLIYWYACRNMFVIAGLGYLTGLIAASPLTYVLARKVSRKERATVLFLHLFLSFTVYFWASGMIVAWRTFSALDFAPF